MNQKSSLQKIRPIILCGGAGTRLWPLSRATYPKQFQPLLTNKSLLQETLLRLNDSKYFLSPIIVCNQEYRFIVQEQLNAINILADKIILEPVGRNTAPAATVALMLANDSPETVFAIFPADHHINPLDINIFKEQLHKAAQLANKNHLVMLGIQPTTAHTGYGYILKGETIDEKNSGFRADNFIEKPNQHEAEKLFESQRYLWNSGIFCFNSATFLSEIKSHQPIIYDECKNTLSSLKQVENYIFLDENTFAKSPNLSIDYAVMEYTDKGAVISAQFDWSDVGNWKAIWEKCEKDATNSVVKGRVITKDISDCYIRAENKMIAAVGLENLVIVETADAVLVAHRDRIEEVKNLVTEMKQQSFPEEKQHLRMYRPWGYYETIDMGENFQVKRIMVKPGGRLSLQMHYHRAEHWVVVSGTAIIQRGEEKEFLGPNQSTYIPMGVKHRLENPGKIPLNMIEIQSGSYLQEDDIVRFEDDYQRTVKTEMEKVHSG